ncbi:hypothetical protein [Rhizobium herbae]|uniref:Uncharacterized protein n=1 Tax=Rhizobium herbae TaxID=508661 RepID=A0ABS4EGU9_9HYPH|nr:hypothetical protein [Rhizobium herbae]MBP1857153.1 hypothetical protein [Rhizobium herbae]
MKTVADLILDLQHATGYDRKLDVSIALVMGYKRQVTTAKGKGGEKERKVIWLYTSGEESRIPFFTAKIDAAKLLAQTLLPGCIGGLTWSPRNATAKINDGPTFAAATPSLALCVAALSAKHFQPDEKLYDDYDDDADLTEV